MLRIAICEDEQEQAELFCNYLKALKPRYSDISFDVFRDLYRSGDDLLEHYARMPKDGHYDIIYTDIRMAGTNGVDTAKKIREIDRRVLFIYITNWEEHVLDAANTYMFRYLLKPVGWEMFHEVFVDAFKTLSVRPKTFVYTKEYISTRLYTDDIIYFEREGRVINIHTKDGKDTIWHQISDLNKELSPYGFVLPHSSFLVNMSHIFQVSQKFIILDDKTTEIPISKHRVKEVRDTFMDYELKRVNA